MHNQSGLVPQVSVYAIDEATNPNAATTLAAVSHGVTHTGTSRRSRLTNREHMMLYSSHRRSGLVLVLVALSLTVLLGIVAIALDGGLLLDQRRCLQSAADAAALAAAIDLYKNYQTNNGLDPGGTAKASALSIANINGYTNNGTTNTVSVSIPPGSGNYAGKAGYAEVIIQYNQQRAFSAIFGSGNLAVSARAVAAGLLKPLTAGIIVLDPTSAGALTLNGNPSLTLNESGAIIVDSNNAATLQEPPSRAMPPLPHLSST
jgi:Flp pilus assembly protein TadG